MTPPPSHAAAISQEAARLSAQAGRAGGAAAAPSRLETVLAQGRLRATLAMLGPAFVAAVAYVDPGNFATNIEGGARYGYMLVWVVVAANLIAMLVQHLSAKLGIVTDRSLPEVLGARLRRPARWGMWAQAEVMAMATDVAEVMGAALGLNLLFGVPMLPAGLLAGALAICILALQARGYRPFELAITALLGIILIGFLYEALRIGPSAGHSLSGLAPSLDGPGSVYLAVGIIGATVMPHVIYLHSALTGGRVPVRDEQERRRLLRFGRLDVIIALALAGLVNVAMLIVSAKLLHHGGAGAGTISSAHAAFGREVGGGAAVAFAIALLASGASSSSVGTYAGQVVMQGFAGRSIPVFARRLVTLLPALAVLAAGVGPTEVLVLSQVILAFGIPFALLPLVRLTSSREVMGAHVNSRLTTASAVAVALLITALNALLIYKQLA